METPVPRKSQLFLHEFIPVKTNYNQLVAAKLKKGKFVFTKTGCIKILGCVSSDTN